MESRDTEWPARVSTLAARLLNLAYLSAMLRRLQGKRRWASGAGRTRRLALAMCGIGLQGWALSALLAPPRADLPRHVALALAAWVVYVVALRLTLSLPGGGRGRDLCLIFGVACLMRATLL